MLLLDLSQSKYAYSTSTQEMGSESEVSPQIK